MDEYWSAPAGNSITGMYRFVINDELNFTEHFVILENEDRLIMKLKHFDKNFYGWEEKNEYVEFELLDIGEKFVKFEGISFESVGSDTLKVLLDLEDNGKRATETFIYRRSK